MRRSSALSLVVLLVAVTVSACGGGEPPPPKHTSVLRTIASTAPAPPPPPAAPPREPPRADASLLPRTLLFSNPDRAQPLLSPDGKRLSYLAAENGVLNVWVAPIDDLAKAKAITHDKKRGVRDHHWAYDSAHVLYPQDKDGDENWHLHAVDVKTEKDVDLTPAEGAQAKLEALNRKAPGDVIVGLNDRDKRFHDVWRIEIATGKKTLVQKNDGFSDVAFDDDMKLRFVVRPDKDGSSEVLAPDGKGGFTSWDRIPHEDTLTTDLVGFDRTGKKLFMLDSRGRDAAALVEIDVATKKKVVLLDDGQADIHRIVQHPTGRNVQAATSSYERLRWHVVDPSFRDDLDAIAAVAPGDLEVASRTVDDKEWLVASATSDAPVKYWLYDRAKRKTTFLFSQLTDLAEKKLAPMTPVKIAARDGLELVSYLTLPPGAESPQKAPLPMVLFVHGGPWSRDTWGLNRWHQWLASRGYAVLSVNYRGSAGFGKKFLNAADHEWAAKMHDDLVDAVTWAVAQRIAEPSRVAIMGGSYGGYATLVGLTFTPKTFACGVDIVGPSNLETLLRSVPPYWEVELDNMTRRIGDHRTEEGRKLLASRSPLTFVDRIERPLLIGQGANDPRVKQAESDQIVKAMTERRIPVTYVVYPDEGHGFARPENRTSFNAVAEAFLAQCLGGAYQPVGADFAGSTLEVRAGKENVVGLADALGRH